ncbi:hypothetical protein BDY21DRAFT_189807 [Lineolata rhizophorae]|uniref:Uncharacterized protein n=1 Tax=Lineolata rhizophorae TaxID=578093 RepID=A0A6A6P7J1_9PEZI|nr:hypothetical protein BDY21DRAFT_189807 [Lineolata rhizophorae]
MRQNRLNDAAIVLQRVFSQAGIKFGIFGGYAIGVLGGFRETKDIDCMVAASKNEVLKLLQRKDGFIAVPQKRQDYIAFLWSNRHGKEYPVLVEIFCETFPEAVFSMGKVPTVTLPIVGQAFGAGQSTFLDPVYIFRGKLQAAGQRGRYHDAADLRWLEQRFRKSLRQSKCLFNIQDVGLAMARYPELEPLFERLGINTLAASLTVDGLDLKAGLGCGVGNVQKGILAPANFFRLASALLLMIH